MNTLLPYLIATVLSASFAAFVAKRYGDPLLVLLPRRPVELTTDADLATLSARLSAAAGERIHLEGSRFRYSLVINGVIAFELEREPTLFCSFPPTVSAVLEPQGDATRVVGRIHFTRGTAHAVLATILAAWLWVPITAVLGPPHLAHLVLDPVSLVMLFVGVPLVSWVMLWFASRPSRSNLDEDLRALASLLSGHP